MQNGHYILYIVQSYLHTTQGEHCTHTLCNDELYTAQLYSNESKVGFQQKDTSKIGSLM